MSQPRKLTTTSYVILGHLALRNWSTYELAQQMKRSTHHYWPRAESKIYEEPKKLVAHGFAVATDDPVGRRQRTRYTITAKGRRALAAWVAEPGDGPVLEFEQLVKIHFADSGTKAAVLANLEAARRWVLEQNEENLATARAYESGGGAFPERAALNQLPGVFLTELYATVARWVVWAEGVVASWPDDVRAATLDGDAARRGVAVAEEIERLLQPTTTGARSPASAASPPRSAPRGRRARPSG